MNRNAMNRMFCIAVVMLMLCGKAVAQVDYLRIKTRTVNNSLMLMQPYDPSAPDVSLSYSRDGQNWQPFELNQAYVLANVGDSIMLRGDNTYVGCNFYFADTVEVRGNIMTLVDAAGLSRVIPSDRCFAELFYNCSTMVSIPELPATTLTFECYEGLFANCVSIRDFPDLPATTLAAGCYMQMFDNCAALSDTIVLPATNLAAWCYLSMFRNCSTLTTPPVLPATILASGCYEGMFNNCIGLQSAPVLPANTMASSCYKEMFAGCRSLSTPPVLSSVDLDDQCYEDMFRNSGLTASPVLPATEMKYGCYSGMFAGTRIPAMPDLPAIVMAGRCYAEMFEGCSFEYVPDFPIRTLAAECYYRMFQGSNVRNVPVLPDTTLAPMCYMEMFSGCQSLKVNENPPGEEWSINATSLSDGSLDGMFDNTSGTMNGTPTANTAYYVTSRLYMVNALANDTTMGTVTGGGKYGYMQTATLVAIPKTGYNFVGWNSGLKDTAITVEVVSDTVITAIFVPGGQSGVNDETDEFDVSLTPNPVHPGMVAYVYGEFGEVETVEILNNSGQVIDRFAPSSYPIEIDGLEVDGLYYVRIITRSGEIFTEKLLVK